GSVGRNKINVRKQNIANKVAPLQQQAWCDPTPSFRPSRYSWRREETLAECSRCDIEIRNTGRFIQAEFPERGYSQLHRTLDLRADGRWAVEITRKENRFQ